METFDAPFEFQGKKHVAHISPSYAKNDLDNPESYQVLIDRYYTGDMYCLGNSWQMRSQKPQPQEIINILGDLIWHFTQ